jgi:cation transport protein ChaC
MADKRLWVFGYGSLMWKPDFPYDRRMPALLRGWHRALCVLSIRYRGTQKKPGLVLGLDHGGSCRGIAFRVAKGEEKATLQALHDREMITGTYDPAFRPVLLDNGQRILAWVFVARRDHPQYRRLSFDEQVAHVRQGHGASGPAVDYLAATVRHLDEMGIHKTHLHRVLAAVKSAK